MAANDSSSLYRNVTVRKNKRKRKRYAEIVKEKISERKGDKQKTLAIEYKKNDDKQENLDNTQSRKTKKALYRNFNESDEDLVNILIDLEPSVEGVSNLDIQFETQVTNKVSDIDLSNQLEFEQTPEIRGSVTEANRLKGYFCSKSVFNLSKKVLTETEISVLEKGLDFAPIQKSLNEPELRKDFEEFSRRMRCKWHFRNELSENFSETPAFRPKSVWKPPKGHPSLEVFLSRLEKELFSDDISESTQSNLSAEEWKALRGLAADKSIVIKGADKGSSVVVWDRSDYLHEASRQLQDQNLYENVKFNENILTELVEKSNKIFKRLCSHKLISEKELKYFTYNFKKATNLGKLYFLPKIHKRLSAVPGRLVISNCGTPTEKVSEYLDYILKLIMQDNWSYIKDSGDFL